MAGASRVIFRRQPWPRCKIRSRKKAIISFKQIALNDWRKRNYEAIRSFAICCKETMYLLSHGVKVPEFEVLAAEGGPQAPQIRVFSMLA